MAAVFQKVALHRHNKYKVKAAAVKAAAFLS